MPNSYQSMRQVLYESLVVLVGKVQDSGNLVFYKFFYTYVLFSFLTIVTTACMGWYHMLLLVDRGTLFAVTCSKELLLDRKAAKFCRYMVFESGGIRNHYEENAFSCSHTDYLAFSLL